MAGSKEGLSDFFDILKDLKRLKLKLQRKTKGEKINITNPNKLGIAFTPHYVFHWPSLLQYSQ